MEPTVDLRGPSLRPAIRTRLLAGATGIVMRPLAEVIPTNRRGIAFTRRLVAGAMKLGDTPSGTTFASVQADGVRGEWVRPRDTTARGVILYLHGSGYAICSTRTHRALVSRLARYTGLPAFSLEYRLAPEHRFPAAADDVCAAYDWLIRQGYRADEIVVAGDSAGGHLALDLIAENARTGQAQPRSVVLFSPLLDLTFELALAQEKSGRDPIISARAAKRLVSLYAADQPADHHRLRLRLEESKQLPPFLIQAGGAEMLRADAEEMSRILKIAGAQCQLQIWPGQLHVFQAFSRLVPEARIALRDAATFITTAGVHRTPHVRSN